MGKQKGLPLFNGHLEKLKAVFTELPHKAGQIAVNHSHKNFENQSFSNGGNSSKWDARKKTDKGRGLLTKSGDLRASVDYEAGVMQVSISSDKPYAQVHNEGGRAGRGEGFIMPKRQFMGPSEDIDDDIGEWLDRQFDSIFE